MSWDIWGPPPRSRSWDTPASFLEPKTQASGRRGGRALPPVYSRSLSPRQVQSCRASTTPAFSTATVSGATPGAMRGRPANHSCRDASRSSCGSTEWAPTAPASPSNTGAGCSGAGGELCLRSPLLELGTRLHAESFSSIDIRGAGGEPGRGLMSLVPMVFHQPCSHVTCSFLYVIPEVFIF